MSTQPKNGGPAYPVPDLHMPNGQIQFGSYGMTLRDHFAGLAMQALLSPNHPWGGYPEKGIPRTAYAMADAMLIARARENGA